LARSDRGHCVRFGKEHRLSGPPTMTRYEDLATHATRWVDQFYRHKDLCRIMIQRVAAAFADYMGCPSGRVSFVGLDGDLRFTGRPALLGDQPHLVRGEDGFWYTGLQVMLQTPNSNAVMKERIRLGINYTGTRYLIALGIGRFEIDESSLMGLPALVEAMLSQSLDHYTQPVHAGPMPPGFMANR